ncbi:angiotensin-converting enzyme-like [Branchiostoma floridae]|uniref:Angiotensin-converting enzyme n=1 Tax=Branchiostoma floridae TaxID=7739 RepID=A0A9J7HHQ7_BRAFL|nr:angiotensin-converting enzyme-like [Branchiostoma floridae]
MWSQSFINIYDLVEPYPNKTSLDVTPKMKADGWTVDRMFRTSDDFFKDMGQVEMPQNFWDNSMFVKPADRNVVCHASAWDFYNAHDVRIKMCTNINMIDLVTIHHEMGHIEYFLQYKHHPVPFRGGANPGFHEAVGDLLALSVSTPRHLQSIGLLDTVEDDNESDINFLMSMALDKVSFLPFGYLMDQWRWGVFNGSITPETYNQEWWKLRTRYQGIVPPVPRNHAKDFDPGCKFHIPANVPYIRYFVSFILQFQFHKALCDTSGHTGPLHKCDISAGPNKAAAGEKLARMLRMGSSQEWPEAMEAITGGQRVMSALPLVDYFQPLITWLEQQNQGETLGWDESWAPPYDCEATDGFTCADGSKCIRPGDRCDGVNDCTDNSDERDCPNKEQEAWDFIWDYNAKAEKVYYDTVVAYWNFNTNLTQENAQKQVAASLAVAQFGKEVAQNASKFDWQNFNNATLKRLFHSISSLGTAAQQDQAKLEELNNIMSEMDNIYSTGKACEYDDPSNCMALNPAVPLEVRGDINKIDMNALQCSTPYLSTFFLCTDLYSCLASSRDYDRLRFCWEGWRDAVGRQLKDKYSRFVELSNDAVSQDAQNWADTGAYWRSWYDIPDFQEQLENLYNQLKPLYNNLHAYVRKKLREQYGEDKISATGPIPAHVLGNMWSQSWINIYDLVEPYPGKTSLDVTPKMKADGWTVDRMFRTSDDFFKDMGQIEMPQNFWNNSMFVKPADRNVVCHASAWDFYNAHDVRIKMCTNINMIDLVTIHHEMGHIEYFLQYKHHPVPFRGGANPGFHEAVGDLLALSVSTTRHLQSIGLLDTVEDDNESDINFLMSMALDKVSFLPFGYLMDQWRWAVFNGSVTPETYNQEWWKLRTRYQGIVPPVPRNHAKDFDPGCKFHIPGNTPYIRYFVSFILQFQFHKALCDISGHTGPLHKCDISAGPNKTAAGEKLARLLQMGSSQEWPEAMEVITGGQRVMSAQPLVDYFQPLITWLEQQNQGEIPGWDESWTPLYDCEATDGFTCADGSKCIRPGDRCDGVNDCADNSDEQYCTVDDCAGGFTCADGSKCIRPGDRCDGVNDCDDNSDEKNCPAASAQSVTVSMATTFISTVVCILLAILN